MIAKGTLIKVGLTLLAVGLGVAGFFTAGTWSRADRAPDLIVLDYVRAVYARDYAGAWEFISATDKQFKTRAAYVAENSAFAGLEQELAYRLAGWIQLNQVKTEIVGDRATVTAHVTAPDGNQPEVSEILQAAEREAQLTAAGRHDLLERLDGLHAANQIEFLEGDQTFTLVREPVGWRVTIGWADAIVVKLTAQVSPGLDWEFYPLQAEVRALPGETLTAVYRAVNRSTHAITGKAEHFVLPEEYEKYFNTIQCFCFIQETLKPGETEDMTLIFRIDGNVPANVREIENRYVFYSIDSFPGN